MTEWDGGHDGGHDAGHHGGHELGPEGPDLPDSDPPWEPLGSGPGHLDQPEDPYGSPAGPGHPDAAAADEPAGLPEEQPADWSQPPDELPHSGPGSWDDTFGAPGAGTDDGTDPAGWTEAAGTDPFPAALDLDVAPGDGGPWVDPGLLGGPDHWTADTAEVAVPVDPPAALLPDLAAADGDPDAGWDTLRDSDDPAVRALARHWNP
ncbi:MAG TPA: hypothetical protein VLM05_11600 [Mycobacteriales bacterium]|nr:hypothetical protein [Mycobacteriales bacterium]